MAIEADEKGTGSGASGSDYGKEAGKATLPEAKGTPAATGDDGKKDPAKDEPAKTDVPAATEKERSAADALEIDLDDLEKDGEGNLLFKVDDRTTYKGKDIKELLSNVKNGVLAGNKYLRQLEIEKRVQPPKKDAEMVEPPLELPDGDKIAAEELTAMAKRENISPEMLSWTDENWNAFQEEKNLKDWQLSRIVDKVESLRKEAHERANKRYEAEAVSYTNTVLIDEETQKVRQMLAKADVKPEDFDYEAVLERVYKDPTNKNAHGTLKAGSITSEAAEEIRRLERESIRASARQSAESEVARAKKEADKVPSSTRINAPHKAKERTFKSYDDAAASAVAESRRK